MALPTQDQLALALSVVKTKPADQSLDDYILGLRHLVRADPSAGHTAVLDPASYWRHECLRLQQSMTATNIECGRLMAKARTHEHIVNKPRSSSKRKANTTNEAPPAKRQKGPDNASRSGSQHGLEDPQPGDERFGEVASLTYQISAALQGAVDDPESLLQLLSSLAAVHSGLLQQHNDPLEARVMAQSTLRVMSISVHAFDALDIADHTLATKSVYQLVKVFETSLANMLHTATSSIGIACGNSDAFTTVGLTSNSTEDGVNMWEDVLSGIFNLLDPAKQHQNLLFEGFLHALLNAIGRALSKVVVDADVPTQERPTPRLPIVVGNRLLRVLNTALSQLPRGLTRTNTAGRHRTISAPLTEQVYKKLQRTLVAATIPDADIFDRAAEYLRAPTQTTNESGNVADKTTGRKKRARSSKTRKKEATEAEQLEDFKRGLWATLGWDILAKEGKLVDALATIESSSPVQ